MVFAFFIKIAWVFIENGRDFHEKWGAGAGRPAPKKPLKNHSQKCIFSGVGTKIHKKCTVYLQVFSRFCNESWILVDFWLLGLFKTKGLGAFGIVFDPET